MAKLPKIAYSRIVRDSEEAEATSERFTFLCLGYDGPLYYALFLTPAPMLVMFQHWNDIRLTSIPDEVSSARPAAAPVVTPGLVASAVFRDQPRRRDGAIALVAESVVHIDSGSAEAMSLWREAWKAASPTDLIFGYKGKIALPMNAKQPDRDWELKRCHRFKLTYEEKPEYREDPQWRASFRAGSGMTRFSLPMLAHQESVQVDGLDRNCLVAVRLTPRFGQYGLRYKVVVGVVPVPEAFEFARVKRRST